MATTKKNAKPPELKGSAVYRADGWVNAMTGINVQGFDKRRAAQFMGKRLTEFEAEELWRGDDIIERAIETTPMVMLRNGFDLNISDEGTAEVVPMIKDTGDGDPFLAGRMDRDHAIDKAALKRMRARTRKQAAGKTSRRMDQLDHADVKRDMAKKAAALKIVALFIEAQQMANAFGGAALWIGTDELGKRWEDRDRQSKKLDPNKLKDIRHLILLRPHECWPTRWYGDDLQPNYGTPSHFYVKRDTMGGAASNPPIVVHESRLIRFYGAVTSRRQMATNNSWGDPTVLRILEIVADFHSAYQGAAHLIQDFAQAVQTVEGLAELIAAGDDDILIKRASMIAQARSIARTVMIDTKESYKREQTPLSGLPDVMDRLGKRVCAGIHMPASLLFGDSPAGLNATGDTDVRWYYDEVANKRELHLRPRLEYLLRLIFLCTEGPTAGIEPAGWKVSFGPLWQPTQKEIAERNFAQAQADALYVTNQVCTPEEIAESRFGGDEWSPDTKLDEEIRDQMAEAHQKVLDDTEEGTIPNPSPIQSAGHQNAIDLAKAQPDPAPGEGEDPKAKVDPKKAAKKKAA